MTRAIIFDCGGVLINGTLAASSYESFLATTFNLPLEKASQIWTKAKDKILKGELTSIEFLRQVCHTYDKRVLAEKVWHDFKEIYLIKSKEEVNWQLLDLVEALRSRYKVYILTDALDFDDEDRLVKEYIYPQFDGVYRSFEMGLRKNDERIFEEVLAKIGAKAKETVLIDDKEGVVELASSLGIRAILYEDNQRLTAELSNLELI